MQPLPYSKANGSNQFISAITISLTIQVADAIMTAKPNKNIKDHSCLK
jgi:hypothetical protein